MRKGGKPEECSGNSAQAPACGVYVGLKELQQGRFTDMSAARVVQALQ
jgi:hypothetical protein